MVEWINTVVLGDSNLCLPQVASSSVDLIVTDPPYGIDYKSGKQNYDTRGETPVIKDRDEYFEKIENDHEIPVQWLAEAYRVLKEGSAMYVFCHWKTYDILKQATEYAGFELKNLIVMNKSNHGMGDLKGSYAPKHELLMFACKGRHRLRFPDGRKSDVWNVPVKFSKAIRLHPNEKPLSWIEPCIINSSDEGDLVLDPFAGSATVALCCKNLKRNHISMEIEGKFVEEARRRLDG